MSDRTGRSMGSRPRGAAVSPLPPPGGRRRPCWRADASAVTPSDAPVPCCRAPGRGGSVSLDGTHARDGASATFSSEGIQRVANRHPEARDRAEIRNSGIRRWCERARPLHIPRARGRLSTSIKMRLPREAWERSACFAPQANARPSVRRMFSLYCHLPACATFQSRGTSSEAGNSGKRGAINPAMFVKMSSGSSEARAGSRRGEEAAVSACERAATASSN